MKRTKRPKAQLVRDPSLDLLRSAAIVCMVIAHTIFFRSSTQEGIWRLLLTFGTNAAFTCFLFCFGISLYKSILLRPVKQQYIPYVVKRFFILLGAYYIVAFFSFGYFHSGLPLNVHFIGRILLLVDVQAFCEFLITFSIYFAVIAVIGYFDKKKKVNRVFLTRYLLLGLFISFLFLLIGNLLFDTFSFFHFKVAIQSYLAQLWGGKNDFHFPIFQYLPILIAGLYAGSALFDPKTKYLPGAYTQFIFRFAYWLLFAATLIRFSYTIIPINHVNLFDRWPPSVLFAITTLGYAMFFFVFFRTVKLPSIINRLLIIIGQHSIGIVVFHLILFFILERLSFAKTAIPTFIIMWFIIGLFGYPFLWWLSRLIRTRLGISIAISWQSQQSASQP